MFVLLKKKTTLKSHTDPYTHTHTQGKKIIHEKTHLIETAISRFLVWNIAFQISLVFFFRGWSNGWLQKKSDSKWKMTRDSEIYWKSRNELCMGFFLCNFVFWICHGKPPKPDKRSKNHRSITEIRVSFVNLWMIEKSQREKKNKLHIHHWPSQVNAILASSDKMGVCLLIISFPKSQKKWQNGGYSRWTPQRKNQRQFYWKDMILWYWYLLSWVPETRHHSFFWGVTIHQPLYILLNHILNINEIGLFCASELNWKKNRTEPRPMQKTNYQKKPFGSRRAHLWISTSRLIEEKIIIDNSTSYG